MFKIALAMAALSSGRQKVGASIEDKKGNVLSVGWNDYDKSHPLQASFACSCGQPNKIYLHAEIDAIIRLKGNPKAHTIKVARIKKNGQTGNAKPCPICMMAIRKSGISNIFYTE